MSIYTKTGDKGTTSVFGGARISKDDILVEAYGSIDELSSYIGLVLNYIKNKKDIRFFINVQRTLYTIMAYLSGARVELKQLSEETKRFEQMIDDITSQLPKLNRFVLYPGSKIASFFHILRVETRKSERRVVAYLKKSKRLNSSTEKMILQYINRLSDLFFTYARKYSKNKEIIT